MFQFHLVKDRAFQLPPNVDGEFRILRFLEVGIESDDKCKELTELKEQMDGYRATDTQLEWLLGVYVGVDLSPKVGGNAICNFLGIRGADGEKSILGRLKDVGDSRGWGLKMRVEINDFGSISGEKVNLRTSVENLGRLSKRIRVGFVSNQVQCSDGVLDIDSWWKGVTFSGTISVICIAHRANDGVPKVVLSFPGSGPVPSCILQKMLDEGLHSDATIVSAEGEAIKCHKFILTGHSDVFEAMFKEASKSTESTTGVIRMDDMCSKSVKSLLAYLYLDDIGNAEADCGVALDVLMAAHKYHLPILEWKMRQILNAKPDEWFNVEVAMRLHFFVKNLEDVEELKKKALLIMKRNHSALNELPAYIELFDEDPHAGRQLCAELIAIK